MTVERLDYAALNDKATNAIIGVGKYLGSIDKKLRALVELRVSQINGCVYCVDLHSTEARAEGETQQRLDCLPVWREAKFFDERERAALDWAEAVTLIADTHAPDVTYNALANHFNEQEIVDLTLIVSRMNALNRLAVGFRHLPEQTDQS